MRVLAIGTHPDDLEILCGGTLARLPDGGVSPAASEQRHSHQSGTLRFGTDPATSVLDPMCRAHDVDNLYAVDGSFFPSVGGGPGGPTLTIAAQALRVAAASGIAS
jgi:choline dehydrogenase-like flavoprotein